MKESKSHTIPPPHLLTDSIKMTMDQQLRCPPGGTRDQ